jgi:hypothetical protein
VQYLQKPQKKKGSAASLEPQMKGSAASLETSEERKCSKARNLRRNKMQYL